MKKIAISLLVLVCYSCIYAQNMSPKAQKWVDSVYKSLSGDQRIAQLIIIRAHSDLGADHIAKVTNEIKKYNIGSVCFFQGGPVRQARLTNFYQSIAKTPILVTIDGEYGLGMRLDSAIKFPYQMTLGAMQNVDLVYKMGLAVAEQCKRVGVHVNYAPTIDINNNPNNPVIGYRSFGEDKEQVANMGIAYTKGMQDGGIMATAKHFPGHGDVAVDSHFDLPVINKSLKELWELELYPFKKLIDAGVQSVMVAHLAIPAIDDRPNRPTSISYNAVTNLLRKQLGFKGITFTDALEMKGVAKFYPGGTIAVEALMAGNDMLCLPESVPGTIAAVNDAIKSKKITWAELEDKVKRVLYAKYDLGLAENQYIDINNITNDINKNTNAIRGAVAQEALTLLSLPETHNLSSEAASLLPLNKSKKIAYVGFTNEKNTVTAQLLKEKLGADIYFINYADSNSDEKINTIQSKNYDVVVLGMHNVKLRKGTDNFGISSSAIKSWEKLNTKNSITLFYGNPLALNDVCSANALAVVYEGDEVFQSKSVDWLMGQFTAKGKLPISVCQWKYGAGIELANNNQRYFNAIGALSLAAMDSIATDAIKKKAFPGCVVLAAKDGQILYYKAFGTTTYDSKEPVNLNSIYDLASVTKTSASTVAVMKLYEEGAFKINKKISKYLPWTKRTNKSKIRIKDLLLHQAGMVPFIPFYKETVDSITHLPKLGLYATQEVDDYTIPVAENMYLKNSWKDTIWNRILKSAVIPSGKKYIYSDNDFWFLGKLVERLSGKGLDTYVQDHFYTPLKMSSTGFLPLRHHLKNEIIPTEMDTVFRHQLLQGYVHDEGAALGGGVAGHAGLFSNAFDLAKLYQMLINGGTMNGTQYFKPETIDLFTSYQSKISRRGLGFDKPEKNNDGYPGKYVSSKTFGHTGFTGTCVWADPENKIVFVFLSNRVNPTRNNSKLSSLKVRERLIDAFYEATVKK
ncbi:MAG: serine hydrolase [Chitinophagaceae bacterium]|nr:MAG: serine hydrolase [Chitinophagaceae bacterium]